MSVCSPPLSAVRSVRSAASADSARRSILRNHLRFRCPTKASRGQSGQGANRLRNTVFHSFHLFLGNCRKKVFLLPTSGINSETRQRLQIRERRDYSETRNVNQEGNLRASIAACIYTYMHANTFSLNRGYRIKRLEDLSFQRRSETSEAFN